MNERFFHKWGSKYILWILLSTCLFGVAGGTLAICYANLTVRFTPRLLVHWVAIATVVVVLALAVHVLIGLWKTEALRSALRLLAQKQPVPADLANKAGRQAVNFSKRHLLQLVFCVPLLTILPACLYMAFVANAPANILIHIIIASSIAIAVTLAMIYFAMQHMILPVLHHLTTNKINLNPDKPSAGLNEKLLHRWGSKYILWMLVSTRFLGVGGGALAIYYAYLNMEFTPRILFHWLVIGSAVVIECLAIQVLEGLWETRALRSVIRLLQQDRPVPPDLAAKASTQAVTFPLRHSIRIALWAPLATTLPACLYMYWMVDAPANTIIHIIIAASIGTIAAVSMIYFAMEHTMQPVHRYLAAGGIDFDFSRIPRGKLQNRMTFCFTMAILVAALMIAVLANQRATDIINSPHN